MGPSPHLWFLHAKQRLWTRITNLYGSQTLPVVLCMQYSVINTRKTCLYGSQPLSVVFACKRATFGAELQVFMGPRLHLWFWAQITACLTQEYKDYMCSSPRLWFCACKTATLALELLVSIGLRTHLCFLHAKERLLDQNNKSLWVPDITCRFVHAIQRN